MDNKDEGCLSDEDIFDDESPCSKEVKSVETSSQVRSNVGRRDKENATLRCRLTGVPPPPSLTDTRQYDVDAMLQLWNGHRDGLFFTDNRSPVTHFHELGYSLNEDSSCEEYELLLLKFSEWYNSAPTASTCHLPSVRNEPDVNETPSKPIDYLKSRKNAVKTTSGPWRLPSRTINIQKINAKTKKTVPNHQPQVVRHEVTDPLKKRKLMWAVSTALKQHGVRLNHPEFKVKFSRLYSKTVAAWVTGGYSVKTSTSDAMLTLANRLL